MCLLMCLCTCTCVWFMMLKSIWMNVFTDLTLCMDLFVYMRLWLCMYECTVFLCVNLYVYVNVFVGVCNCVKIGVHVRVHACIGVGVGMRHHESTRFHKNVLRDKSDFTWRRVEIFLNIFRKHFLCTGMPCMKIEKLHSSECVHSHKQVHLHLYAYVNTVFHIRRKI